jgi:hypothetical protein
MLLHLLFNSLYIKRGLKNVLLKEKKLIIYSMLKQQNSPVVTGK